MASDFDWDYDGLARLYLLGNDVAEECTREIAADMRRTVPVDTGELLASIEDVEIDGRGVITVGTDHWKYVEYGTSRMHAQPFIRPALYRNRRA